MPLDHYLTQFTTTNICKYNDDDIAFTIHKMKPVAQRTFFEFKLDQPHSLEILLNQMGNRLSRGRRKDGTQFEPSWFNMTLCQTEGQQGHQGTDVSLPFRFIASSVSSNYQVHLSVPRDLLRPGKYVLIVEALWHSCASAPDSDYQSFCVKVLSKAKVKMSLTDKDETFFL